MSWTVFPMIKNHKKPSKAVRPYCVLTTWCPMLNEKKDIEILQISVKNNDEGVTTQLGG